jgi:hypothetical protein
MAMMAWYGATGEMQVTMSGARQLARYDRTVAKQPISEVLAAVEDIQGVVISYHCGRP